MLNKIDLCPAPLVLAWKDYFTTTYKGLQVVCFTSFPAYNLHGNLAEGASGTMKKVLSFIAIIIIVFFMLVYNLIYIFFRPEELEEDYEWLQKVQWKCIKFVKSL